jgi:hypothetical protein
MAIRVGLGLYGSYGISNTGFGLLDVNSDDGQVVARTVEKGKTYRGTDAWSVAEWEQAFGLRKGSIILVTGMTALPGKAAGAWFQLIMDKYPATDIQDRFQFTLGL